MIFNDSLMPLFILNSVVPLSGCKFTLLFPNSQAIVPKG